MSWAEIKKAVNSDLSAPLNSKIDAQTITLANKFGLEYVETATFNANNGVTFSRSYDAIVLPIQMESLSVYKGTSSSGPKVFQSNSYKSTPFFKVKKDTDYIIYGTNGVIFAFYKLGGVFNLLKNLTSTNLEKGGVLV